MSEGSGSRVHRRGTNAALLAGGLLAGLLLAELSVRWLDLPPSPLGPLHVPSYRLLDDPVLRYGYRPNLAPDHAAYDPMHRGLSTNASGFRDVEHLRAKPPGVTRILVLGDSTTVGLGVPELENTWPKRLERRLHARGHPEVQVLNLAVGGYDPEQEVALLETEGLTFDPDLVLMLVCLNDLERDVDGGVYEALRAAHAHLEPSSSALARMLSGSRLFFVAYHRTRASAPPRDERNESRRNPLDVGLTGLARISRERGLPALVFLLPALDAHVDQYTHLGLHRRMAAIAERVGGPPWIDLFDDMAKANPNLRLLSFDGLHPNRVGQAVLAEQIDRHLHARGLP